VFIRNIIPDGKKLATYGQCQWHLTSVAISVFPIILSCLILHMSHLQLLVVVNVQQPITCTKHIFRFCKHKELQIMNNTLLNETNRCRVFPFPVTEINVMSVV
jgi:hypothetical protein